MKKVLEKPLLHDASLISHVFELGDVAVKITKFSALASQSDEVKKAAKVTEWLSKGLISVLPEKVQPDLLKIAVSGHSRGGKTAFSLALGYGDFSGSTPTPLKFQALLGIDPVADDKIAAIASLISKSGKGSKDLMRKVVGGIVVAFLEAKLGGQVDFLNDIVKTPSLAPITLDPVISMTNN
ncbi:hypothetical protein RND71_006941 [Anisodus tanguticus]|uniref:Chlorophyllase n=1 Tax=Anisodus tanguticus TaxID=243964 RepID=A0AAE1SUT6_9SOLA|nr:hypothetical protein RND71_006941 [Anisodus tanguticus]